MLRKDLEKILSNLDTIKKPKVLLEQYQTDVSVAVDILFLAYNDIKGKVVADFGTGNGIFAIGSKILGAKHVYGLDVDKEVLNTAIENAKKIGVEIEFLSIDVKNFKIKVDTVIMNPPFGYQIPFSDKPFMEKAMEVSDNIYFLHSKDAREHILKVMMKNFMLVYEKDYKLNLPYTFKFHKKEMKSIDVTLFAFRVMK